ncbi:hypothetical protein ABK040_005707 [Willaertia magna]
MSHSETDVAKTEMKPVETITPGNLIFGMFFLFFVSFFLHFIGANFVKINNFSLIDYIASTFVLFFALIGGFQLYFKTQKIVLNYYKENQIYDMDSWIDNYIPFIPDSIWVYTLGDLLIMTFTIPTAHSMNALIRIVFGLLFVTIAQCTIFLLWPTCVPKKYRNVLENYEKKYKLKYWTKWLYDKMYSVDDIANACPSGHCSIATYLALCQLELFGYWTLLNPISIAISCVLTKQHAFVDTFVGMLFGTVIFILSEKYLFL